jgi:hypothetical protein
MRFLALLFTVFSVDSAELKPGLLVEATDGQLTAQFVVAKPNVRLEAEESIHPQLKPSFRAEFSGYLVLPEAGEFRFPEGHSIFVDGKDCAGKTVTVPAGERRLRIVASRETNQTFSINLPFPATAFVHDREPRELKENVSRDFGRQLFEDLNCAACHGGAPMTYRFTPLPDVPKAKSLRGLHPTQGCLADPPETNVPKFELSAAEREALQLFVQTPDISRAPLVDFARLIKQFKCADCHSNLADFRISEFAETLHGHWGLTISTNDAAELARTSRALTAE